MLNRFYEMVVEPVFRVPRNSSSSFRPPVSIGKLFLFDSVDSDFPVVLERPRPRGWEFPSDKKVLHTNSEICNGSLRIRLASAGPGGLADAIPRNL